MHNLEHFTSDTPPSYPAEAAKDVGVSRNFTHTRTESVRLARRVLQPLL